MKRSWIFGAGVGALLTLAFLRSATMWRQWMPEEAKPLMRLLVYGVGAALIGWSVCVAVTAHWRRWRTERVFLLLFIPLSLAMMAATPIERAIDEQSHLRKIWQISVGDWMPTRENGGVFHEPVNLFEGIEDPLGVTLEMLYAQRGVELDMENLVAVDAAANTGFYPVHNYFPQALCMFLVRCITRNRLAIFYAARVGAWLVTLLVLYAAIRRTPVGKNAILLVALTPISLQELSSASADGMTIAFVCAFVAHVLDLCRRQQRMTHGEDVRLFLLAFCAATFKMMYCPFVLLLCAVPAECFGGEKRKRAVVTAMIGGIVALILGWGLLCKLNYAGDTAAQAGNILTQASLMVREPFRYGMTFLRTLMIQLDDHLVQMTGRWLSWYNIEIPSGVYVGYLLLFFAAMTRETGLCRAQERLRLLFAAMCSACVIIIFTSLYLWWTPQGYPEILGVQGRYFLPLVPAAVLAAKRPTQEPVQSVCLPGYALGASLLSICAWAIVLVFCLV